MFPFASACLLAEKVHILQEELLPLFGIEVFISEGEPDG